MQKVECPVVVDNSPDPGLGLTILDLCHALKANIAKCDSNSLPVSLIIRLEKELEIVAAEVHQLRAYHNSKRFPPKVLAEIAFHFDGASLIKATHVCKFWREALTSTPHLWAVPCFSFEKEQRDLCFLERSGSLPVYVNLKRGPTEAPSNVVKQSLKGFTHRLVSLGVAHDQFKELLAQPLPALKHLDLAIAGEFPSVASLSPDNLCRLTRLRLELSPASVKMPGTGDGLMELLQGCPLMEDVCFRYGVRGSDLDFTTNKASTRRVSLPCLRAFTHESPYEIIPPDLFDRLSLPPTCGVHFTVHNQDFNLPWDHGFPTPRGLPYLSDIKTVKILFDPDSRIIRVIFFDFNHKQVSFNSGTSPETPTDFVMATLSILDFLGRSDMVRSVQSLEVEGPPHSPKGCRGRLSGQRALNFDNLKTLAIWQFSPILFLGHRFSPTIWDHVQDLEVFPPACTQCLECRDSFLKGVRKIAVSRKESGDGRNPLKSLTLYLSKEDAEWYGRSDLSRVLSNCVESVTVLCGDQTSQQWLPYM